MAMSWVGGIESVDGVSSLKTVELPVVLDGDGVFLFVVSDFSITPPVGWTLLGSQVFSDGIDTRTLTAWQKDAVLNTDSGLQFDVDQGSSGYIAVTCCAVRGVRAPVVVELLSDALNEVATYEITPPQVSATGDQIFLAVCTSIAFGDPGTSENFTADGRWTGDTYDAGRKLAGSYQVAVATDINFAEFTMATGTAPINGLAAMTLRISDASLIQAAAVDGISSSDDLLRDGQQGEAMSEGVSLGEVSTIGRSVALRDAVGFIEYAITARVHNGLAFDTADFTDAIAKIDFGHELVELVRMGDPTLPTLKYNMFSVDEIRVAELIAAGRPVSLTDGVSVASVLQVLLSARVIDRMGLTESLGAKATYGLTLTQAMRLGDSLRNFFAGEIQEYLGISSVLLRNHRSPVALSDLVSIAHNVKPTCIFRVIAEDRIDIDPTQILNLIYNGQLGDEIEITAAYLSPGSSFTTWVVNTRTGYTSEYTNYEFNSFARAGNKILGASASGLYELNGDDDAGSDIIAHIKAGWMQFEGSRLSSFKAVYLGTRGDGNFVLKVLTGDGKTYTYAVTAKSMETTRVRLGKGLRARYFAFELISTGQDFDLDSIEFIPLVAKRRV